MPGIDLIRLVDTYYNYSPTYDGQPYHVMKSTGMPYRRPAPPRAPTLGASPIVEGWSSLIWTERFLEPGEFQLKTTDVDYMRLAMPIGSVFSIRGSKEAMMVETHAIEPGSSGAMELTVSGRSMDLFFDERFILQKKAQKFKMRKNYTSSQAAAVVMWNSVCNNSAAAGGQNNNIFANDVLAPGVSAAFPHWWWTWKSLAIENAAISNSSTKGGDVRVRWLDPGPAKAMISKFLRQQELGIRTIRPTSEPGTSRKIVSVNAAESTARGTYSETATVNSPLLLFDIYHGTDRSADQAVVSPVIFRHTSGDLVQPKYLFSVRGMKNGAAGRHPSNPQDWGLKFADGGVTVRAMLHDPGDLPEGEDDLEFRSEIIDTLKNELEKLKEITQVDVEISPTTQYKFGEHYGLGDLVTVNAEYGVIENMRVTEFTRSMDVNGYREFPGLSRPFDVDDT